MLHFLVTMRHSYTINWLLAVEMRDLLGRVRISTYDQLPFFGGEALRGTVLFSDIERLPAPLLAAATDLANRLEARGERVLNHPGKALRRYDLLRFLHMKGVNRSNVHRLRDRQRPARYPVFIRRESEHSGSIGGLLQDEAELLAAAERLWPRPESRDLLVVEYSDVLGEDGLYRKYGAFMIAGRIVPRHLLFSRRWMQKDTDLSNPELDAEERRYIETNPHAALLQAALAGSGLDYGRIDYGLLDGRPQIWEVNTNPIVVNVFKPFPRDWLEAHRLSMDRIREGFAALAG